VRGRVRRDAQLGRRGADGCQANSSGRM
jgi:hypothetical protein